MPTQTTEKNFLFPDGCQFLIKEYGAASYTDCGAINSQVANSVTFDENQLETANAGTTEKQINNMKVDCSLTLINWSMDVLEKLSGGMISKSTTLAAGLAAIPDQEIPIGWADNTLYEIEMETSATDSTLIRLSAPPTLTSVILDPDSVNETLVEGTEYYVIATPNTTSGYSIGFLSEPMSDLTPTAKVIVIDYDTNTPIASETLNVGASTVTLKAAAFRFKHTDEAGLIRQLDLHSVDPNSGFLEFNFKGANEDGLEELPLTFQAKIDSSKSSGQQLFSFTYEDGAA